MKKLLFFLFSPLICFSQIDTNYYTRIKEINSDHIISSRYDVKTTDTVSITDLQLIDGINDQYGITNFFKNRKDFRIYLLEEGYAKIKDISTASKEEIIAENTAKEGKKGMWYIPPPAAEGNKMTWGDILGIIVALLGFLGAGGTWAIIRYINARRLKLLILGEMSTGKTALYHVLLDPQMSKDAVLNLETSSEINSAIRERKINVDNYTIIPRITDVPGSQHDMAFENIVGNPWDLFLGYNKYAVVFTVCPIEGKDPAAIDQRYIDVQFGIIKAYLGAINSSKPWRVPKQIVLFITKFDLFSEHRPYDPISKTKREEMLKIFENHIAEARHQCERKEISFDVIIGSAAEHWSIQRLLNAVIAGLYKNKSAKEKDQKEENEEKKKV